ncbi:aldo/keto reductase [Phreatobacter stygius]|uniref:Aldo/keto reductase n=1 Tax=Phreatobacter stygius TaxID=1940610 RepID=A0A4D7B692_9HYPH|nr:aldo/keto reductase [Phreatobacter stygius]QCI65888.1 aldo/keto reductase [Phreatobacter stygius]
MNHRPLGRSGLSIAPLMFGGNVFGWTAEEATSFGLLDAFVAEGFNAIDTADVYSAWAPGHAGGESETVIGNWLKRRGRRDDVVIATKVGMWAKYPDLKAATIAVAVEESLKRLQTDYIDLYQSHKDDAATPQDEGLEAYSRLIKAGKVRAIGASNFSAARLASALDVAGARDLPRYVSVQPAYNLYNRAEFEGDLAKVVSQGGLGVISYFALAAGFLTGKYRTEADLAKSPRGAGVKNYLDERGFRILAALDAVSAELGATQAQVALAWLIGRPGVTAPIVSATSLTQLTEILKAARLVLPADAVAKLDAASA